MERNQKLLDDMNSLTRADAERLLREAINDRKTRVIPLSFLAEAIEKAMVGHFLRFIKKDSENDDEPTRANAEQLIAEANPTWDLGEYGNTTIEDDIRHLSRPDHCLRYILTDIGARDPTSEEKVNGLTWVLDIEDDKVDWSHPDLSVLTQTAWPTIMFGVPLLEAYLEIPSYLHEALGIKPGLRIYKRGMENSTLREDDASYVFAKEEGGKGESESRTAKGKDRAMEDKDSSRSFHQPNTRSSSNHSAAEGSTPTPDSVTPAMAAPNRPSTTLFTRDEDDLQRRVERLLAENRQPTGQEVFNAQYLVDSIERRSRSLSHEDCRAC
jgi:hypothetical protein